MLASLPTPYDRSAIAIAAGGDAQVLSPNGTTLVTAGGRDGDGESPEVTKRLTFSRVKQRPSAGGILGIVGGGGRGTKRDKENDEDVMAEMGGGSGGKGKKPRVSFGSSHTKLYHPSEVVSTKKRKQVPEEEGEVPVLKKQQVVMDAEDDDVSDDDEDDENDKDYKPKNPVNMEDLLGRGRKRPATGSDGPESSELMSPPTSNKRSRPPPRPKSIHASLRGSKEDEDDRDEEYVPRGYITSPIVGERSNAPRVINPLLTNMEEGGLLGSPQVWGAKPQQTETETRRVYGGTNDTMVVTLLSDEHLDDSVAGAKGGMSGRVGMWGRQRKDVEGRVERIIKGGGGKGKEKKAESSGSVPAATNGGPPAGSSEAAAAAAANAAASIAPLAAPLPPAPVASVPAAGAAPSFSFGSAAPSAPSSSGGILVSGPPQGTQIQGFGGSSLQQATGTRRSRRSKGRGKR